MIIIYTITVLLAIAVTAFFTASEMAFTAASKIRLKELAESGDRRAVKLNEFISREGMFLGTTLVGTNITVIIASTLATRILSEYFHSALLPLVTTMVMVPIMLIFAEIVPKIISRQFATEVAHFTVAPLNSFFKLFRPVIISVNAVAAFLLKPFQKDAASWDSTFTKKDIKSLLVSGHEAGEVETDELELIHKVLDFGSKNVFSNMIPLFRVSSIEESGTIRELKKLVEVTGFSRVPVYQGKKNNITGLVNIYEVLYAPSDISDDTRVSDFVRPPVSVGHDDGLDIALTRLRNSKQPMGIVTKDDKAVGIITIEDMLEELVGNIEDRTV